MGIDCPQFYACCDELDDISFIEALYQILSLVLESIREIGSFCEKTAQSFFDTVMEAALAYVNLSKNQITINEI